MATLKLMLKDKRFIEHNGVNVETFSSNYVEGNGWRCNIDDNGNVCCIAEKTYDGINHRMKFTIKQKCIKIIHRMGTKRPKVMKCYQVEGDISAGIIGLPAGRIERRKPYFREAAFQGFLDEYGLTAVRCKDANGIFVLIEQYNENGEKIFCEEIEATDGEKETIFKGFIDDSEDTIQLDVEVTNASWTIKKVVQPDGQIHRILYTRLNPKEIPNLPI